MTDTKPDRITNLLESAIKNNTAAWAAQSRYFDELIKRNVASFTSLSDARVASLREISESQTFNEAFEANIAYENAMREELGKLYEENQKAWEGLQTELKGIYSKDDSEEEVA